MPSAYSVFDKIAFFLNDYAKLNINPKQIYFKRFGTATRIGSEASARNS
ncbi:hypothetical protein GWG65_33630 [Bradyrhizobium sp. CSA207]|nr:hypothetical protein [Bradyrhizobium sp. CSA207]